MLRSNLLQMTTFQNAQAYLVAELGAFWSGTAYYWLTPRHVTFPNCTSPRKVEVDICTDSNRHMIELANKQDQKSWWSWRMPEDIHWHRPCCMGARDYPHGPGVIQKHHFRLFCIKLWCSNLEGADTGQCGDVQAYGSGQVTVLGSLHS